jgi:signal transduction histidine kinase
LFLLFLYIYFITELPLKSLAKAAKEYSSGNYNYSFTLKGLSEFRDLGAAISYMSGELAKLDDYQKKFVANISHDFRSPLTSIKGYAEAIKDGTIPYENQEKYLNIILFESERLTKLTSNLLELNRFENKGAFLDITSFDINHIIKMTAESFEGSCREKKITLNLVFSSKKTPVDADMGKIQQVLYNLIDNAIKFSHPNSKIKVSTEEKGDKVFISVKDYGIGIPKESIKKVWERFYKTDASRGKDKKGTGLGLSITKEIIQAHNENINVISTEGVGTEFVFSLTKTAEE